VSDFQAVRLFLRFELNLWSILTVETNIAVVRVKSVLSRGLARKVDHFA
jgi:hypothetical protein